MMCSRCGKRPAVVFVSTNNSNEEPKGYCLLCAKELGLKPVDDIMKRMGISPEDLEGIQATMDSMMENGDFDEISDAIVPTAENQQSETPDPDTSFSPGGAPSFPNFFNMFGNGQNKTAQKKDKKKDPKQKNRKFISLYCYDLTKKAREGKTDRVVGRDHEIERVIQILSRRTKNNPCLIGEPGVGKTAIAEGLAIKIANGDVPHRLKDKEIQLLDLTALIAGTQFRGQFESRIKGLTQEVKEAGNIILFIDEVHNLVGTGDAEGTMNAANILKPALSRGEIQVIGATTFNEYRKYIEKDSALERRFQPVKVGEPSIGDTIEILNGVKEYYEKHHRVKVGDDIVRKSAVFSERYITDRFLPDKAIDLLDEACACASLRNTNLEEWETLNDKKIVLLDQKNELESVGEGQEIDYESLANVKSELAKVDAEIDKIDIGSLTASVTEEDLAKVIELWTGIPQSRVRENELLKIANIEDDLKKKIIGQDEAVDALAKAIKRSRVQISPRRRPASFIFVGPTGVGKTELVKVLSQLLFDSPETLIRLDMSEFMEKHSVSKIIGSPPGYVGYDEAGQVTEKVRRRPYSVLLFDEIEKAHPDVMNILLQMLDEGKLTDAHGRTVDFSNTVIVMTSNAGSNKTETSLGFGKSVSDQSKEKVMKALSEFLRPEFIARVDEIIVFSQLTDENYVEIAGLMLSEYVDSLHEKGISFKYDKKACEYLAKKATGGNSGARDLRNLIRKEVEDKITTELITAGEGGLSGISISADENGLTIETI